MVGGGGGDVGADLRTDDDRADVVGFDELIRCADAGPAVRVWLLDDDATDVIDVPDETGGGG